MNILLVEDNRLISRNLCHLLSEQEYEVTVCGTYREAEEWLRKRTWDLFLVDIMLPDGNGLDLCRMIRKERNVPVIFLTSCDDEESVIAGLEAGADDYVTKPFRSGELVARVRANLRKWERKEKKEIVLTAGELSLNVDTGVCKLGNREISLRKTELDLLAYMMQNAGLILRREQILQALWDVNGEYVEDNTLSVHISRLREKISQDGVSYIETVRRVGYRFVGK